MKHKVKVKVETEKQGLFGKKKVLEDRIVIQFNHKKDQSFWNSSLREKICQS